MKLIQTTLAFAFIICMMTSLNAQKSGVITYQETMKLDIQIDDAPAGVDLSGMLPSSRSVSKILTFDGNKAEYADGKEEREDHEFTSDDGSIQIVFAEDEHENKLYTDYKEMVSLNQQGFMGKAFVINEPMEKTKWKITGEKVKYLDYECIKATTTDEEGRDIVAWFAPAIPIKAGPSGFGHLPGAILMLSRGDQELEIKATNVELKEVDEIKKPKDGKKVSKEEYDKIVEEKIKEMEKEYGGRGIMIRG